MALLIWQTHISLLSNLIIQKLIALALVFAFLPLIIKYLLQNKSRISMILILLRMLLLMLLLLLLLMMMMMMMTMIDGLACLVQETILTLLENKIVSNKVFVKIFLCLKLFLLIIKLIETNLLDVANIIRDMNCVTEIVPV